MDDDIRFVSMTLKLILQTLQLGK